jgi:hypothetical protein
VIRTGMSENREMERTDTGSSSSSSSSFFNDAFSASQTI